MPQGIYQTANELGIHMPSQLGVLGFGNLEIGSLLDPPLTSVNIPVEIMAKTAVNMIFEEISGNKTGSDIKTIIPAQSIIRDSC